MSFSFIVSFTTPTPAHPIDMLKSSAKWRITHHSPLTTHHEYNSRMHNGFTQELARWGPQARYGAVSRSRAQAYCAQLARTHYENFSVATLLLPRRLIPHFHHIYAYC